MQPAFADVIAAISPSARHSLCICPTRCSNLQGSFVFSCSNSTIAHTKACTCSSTVAHSSVLVSIKSGLFGALYVISKSHTGTRLLAYGELIIKLAQLLSFVLSLVSAPLLHYHLFGPLCLLVPSVSVPGADGFCWRRTQDSNGNPIPCGA